MDVKYVNPFIKSFLNIMEQIGFSKVEQKNLTFCENITCKGVIVNVGLVGAVKGSVVYSMSISNGKQVVSKMMMGADVNELDDMAQSAISELANMLTGHASIEFSDAGMDVDISTPTLIVGESIDISVDLPQIIRVEFEADGLDIVTYIALQVAGA